VTGESPHDVPTDEELGLEPDDVDPVTELCGCAIYPGETHDVDACLEAQADALAATDFCRCGTALTRRPPVPDVVDACDMDFECHACGARWPLCVGEYGCGGAVIESVYGFELSDPVWQSQHPNCYP
jgi:hypothetical protein